MKKQKKKQLTSSIISKYFDFLFWSINQVNQQTFSQSSRVSGVGRGGWLRGRWRRGREMGEQRSSKTTARKAKDTVQGGKGRV